MRLTLEHTLRATVQQFWKHIFEDESFNRELYLQELGYGYELIEWSEETGERVAKVVPNTEVPRPVAAVLGGRISFTEHGTYDRAGGVYTFEVIPSTLSERIRTKGTVRAEPSGKDQCIRTVELEITARFPGVGKLVERFLMSTTRDQYDQNARFANQYLDRVLGRG